MTSLNSADLGKRLSSSNFLNSFIKLLQKTEQVGEAEVKSKDIPTLTLLLVGNVYSL